MHQIARRPNEPRERENSRGDRAGRGHPIEQLRKAAQGVCGPLKQPDKQPANADESNHSAGNTEAAECGRRTASRANATILDADAHIGASHSTAAAAAAVE